MESVIGKFNLTRLENALAYKRFDRNDIQELTEEVQIANAHIFLEHNRLARRITDFLECYAPDDLKYYDIPMMAMCTLRSSCAELKRLVARFTPTQRKLDIYRLANNRPLSVYYYSVLARNELQLRINFNEDLDPDVAALQNEITLFFCFLRKSIQICKDVKKQEEEIKKDPKHTYNLYLEFRDKVLKNLNMYGQNFIPLTHPLMQPENNPVIKCRQQYPSIKAFAPHGYHLGNRELGTFAVIAEEYERQQQSDSTLYELELFGNDELVRKCREVIKHFDKLIPEEYTGKKIPAKYVAFFFRYIGLGDKSTSKAYQYFSRIYNQEDHKLKLTGYAAVVEAYNKVRLGENSEFDDFVERINQTYGNCSNVNIAHIG